MLYKGPAPRKKISNLIAECFLYVLQAVTVTYLNYNQPYAYQKELNMITKYGNRENCQFCDISQKIQQID